MKHLRFTSSEGGEAFSLAEFIADNRESEGAGLADWVVALNALPIGGTWQLDHHSPTLTRVADAPVPVTLNTLDAAIAHAAARCSSAEDRALVDAAEAEMIFARTHGDITESLIGAVLALEAIAKHEPAELSRKIIGSKGDEYVLTREHSAAPWRTCSCPAFTKGRWTNGAPPTSCKHTRASNEAAGAVAVAMIANDAKAAPLAKASAVDPLAHYRATYLPETIEVFGPRLLRLEQLNQGSDHRAYAAMARALIAEVESWDRSVRVNSERAAGAGR